MTVPRLWQLPWSALDPAGREFDADRIPALVRGLSPAGEMMSSGAGRWYPRMTAALHDQLGPWAVGWAYTIEIRDRRALWRWAPPPITTPERTLAAVADAVVAWHELLVEISTDARGRFAVLPVHKGKGTGDGPPAWKALRRPAATPTDGYPVWAPPQWANFDPTGRKFDASTLPKVAYNTLLNFAPHGVTAGLVRHYGAWVSGWDEAPGAEPTVDGIVRGVLGWHAWLVDVAQNFDRLLPLPGDDPDGWEEAGRYVITAAGELDDYGLDWTSRCATLFRWLLQAAGVSEIRHEMLIDFSLEGQFDDAVSPSPAKIARVAEDLALFVTTLPDPRPNPRR